MLKIKYNVSIKNITSFSTNVYAKYLIKINNLENLYKIFNLFKSTPLIIMGNGTNTIFLNNFSGIIIINNIKSIKINKDNKYYRLHVGSGMNWNNLILYTLKNNIFGLENLAMIPGKVGAAPVFNIGAYGLEIKDVCEYVDILDLKRKKIIRFNNNRCKFKYRSSLFSKINNKYIVMYLGLKLLINWKPILKYNKLKTIKKNNQNPIYIYNFICNLRKKNIPNYKILNNAGSFFKNLILKKKKILELLLMYKNVPYNFVSKYKFKISTGWLIDMCNFKGFRIGNIYVDNKNSAILVNIGSINNDIIFLIKFIYYIIYTKFNIKINLEVFMYFNNKKIILSDIN